MNDGEESKEFENLKDQIIDKLAEGISTIIRSIDDKKKRLDTLNNMNPKPSSEHLKKVYNKALEKEDYETCETIKEYFNENGIKL